MSNKLELLPLVDIEGNVIGSATRGECHSNPSLIHPVIHCWIFNSRNEVLWQQRSLLKDGAPGMWDMSCGGHIAFGEKEYSTLIRELEEELRVQNVKPILVDKYLLKSENQTELVYLYYVVVDKEEHEFKLQKEEVEQLKWIDINEAQRQYKEKEVEATEFIVSQVNKIIEFRKRNNE